MNAKSKAFAFISVALMIGGAFICCSMISDDSSAETLNAKTIWDSNQTDYYYTNGTSIQINGGGDANPMTYSASPYSFTLSNNGSVSVTITMFNMAIQTPIGNKTVVFHGITPNYTVTFNSMGGSAVTSQSVSPGGHATQPANPTNGVKVFGGWFTDENCTQAFNFSTAINSNITLYAKWTTPSASVTSSHGNSSMVVGQLFSYNVSTNPGNATVSVSGANWLRVSEHTVYGTPTSPGTYNVTITSSASGYNNGTQSFTITVSSILAPSNAPSNGVIAYVR